jgi:tRNA-2-methylthio-N6-dimethylallyladenosine synthase
LDLLCGPGELNRLPALLDQLREGRRRVAALVGKQQRSRDLGRRAEDDPLEALDVSRTPPAGESVLQSYVRVQRGCDKFCTYCVVPFTRGPERSRPAEHIVEEVRRLANLGCREVTLLGQTVNSYAYVEGDTEVSLARLLERVQAVPGLDRVRFVTSYPADWDDDIFRVMRDYPRVMPYLHVPAQSGSDRILGLMRRGYTVADYLRLVDAARQYIPHIGLAGDFIVGFCGETEEDFQASVELLRRVQYQNVFVFKYSPRPGTTADRRRADDVPPEVKSRRNNELLAIQSEISLAHKRALLGHTVEVLVEGFSKVAKKLATAASPAGGPPPPRAVASAPRGRRRAGKGVAAGDSPSAGHSREPLRQCEQDRGCEVGRDANDGSGWGLPGQSLGRQLVGRTPTDQIVVFEGGPELIGALVTARIEAASAFTLFGSVQSVISPARGVPATSCRPLPVLT